MQAEPLTRILLIDDHRLFIEGIKRLLDDQPDLRVCGQVFRADDVIPTLQRTTPHLVLLDVNLNGTNGIDLGKTIVGTCPAIRVLILTTYNQPKLLDDTRKAGLHGYLLKDATTIELLRGVRTVLAGQTYFDPNVAGPAASPKDSFGDDFVRRFSLTFREIEIISLIRLGLSTEQIAERLYLSVQTVKTHRKNIHFKLGITKVTDLVQFAVKHGL